MGANNIAGLEFDMRPDGVYLQVGRDVKNPPTPGELESAFRDRNIINADVNKMNDIIKRRRGVFEFAGPPFKIYNKDKDKYISIVGSPMEIKCKIYKSSVEAGIEYTFDDILHKLEEKNISFGIDKEAIDAVLKIENIGEELETIIAVGRDAQNGFDASIEEVIQIDSSLKPSSTISGRVDFKDVDNLQTIKEGAVIATKHLPTPGKPGMSVFGKPIPPVAGKDLQFSHGANTELRDDGKNLVASLTGFVYRGSNGITIGDTFMVKDNLDFNVGNIKYKGDVVIQKDVLAGFKVIADGDVFIGGQIEAAEIHSRFGSVKIEGGIFGKDKCIISAKKDVEIEYAQHAEISSDENLIINGYSINCKLFGKTGVVYKNSNSIILGGSCTTYGILNLNDVGNEKRVKSQLFIKDPDQEKYKEKAIKLTNVIRELKENVQKNEISLKNYNKILQQFGPKDIPPKIATQLKLTISEYQQSKNKVVFMEREQEKVKKLSTNREEYPGKIIIRGVGWPDIDMNICYTHKKITSKVTNKQFQLKESNIQDSVIDNKE